MYNQLFISILRQLGISSTSNKLAQAFTHQSYHTTKNNSKWVFIGRYAFKGEVAKYIYKNIGGTGKELQQLLGNITGQKYAEKLFDSWAIANYCKIADGLQLHQQKHIMVYGLLGLMMEQATTKKLQDFIYTNFIEPNEHLLPKTYIVKNEWEQLKLLCRQIHNTTCTITHTLVGKLNSITVTLPNNTKVEAQSISYKYARKKAIKKALQALVQQQQAVLQTDAAHIQTLQHLQTQKEIAIAKAKQAKQNALAQKQQVKKETKLQLLAQKQQQAIEADKKRRQAKTVLKEKVNRKGKDTIYRAYSPEEIAAMSNSKRRNLQDKGIIAKGL
jgi:hypothetical protein